jgi:hypothetical protein
LAFNPFEVRSPESEAYSIIMLIAILLVAAAIIAKTIHRYRKTGRGPFERFLVVDANSISNFAMIFAGFSSHDLYHLMPPSPRIFPPNDPGWLALVTNRDLMSIVVFVGLWHGVKVFLTRVLELNPQVPSQGPPPSDSSGPYVPFDPFHPYSAKPPYSPPQ